MPVVINEVIIRTTVDSEHPPKKDTRVSGAPRGATASHHNDSLLLEKVLELIQEKSER